MTTVEFKAYCAELAAKIHDGRALQEARERLAVSRLRRLYDPESRLDAEYEKDLAEESDAQGVNVRSGARGFQGEDVCDLLTPRRQSGQ